MRKVLETDAIAASLYSQASHHARWLRAQPPSDDPANLSDAVRTGSRTLWRELSDFESALALLAHMAVIANRITESEFASVTATIQARVLSLREACEHASDVDAAVWGRSTALVRALGAMLAFTRSHVCSAILDLGTQT